MTDFTTSVYFLTLFHSGGEGTVITINGTMFSDVQSENNVKIGSSDCDVISSSEDQIVCELQSGAGKLKSCYGKSV